VQADELKTTINKLASSLGFELCRITRPTIAAKHTDALDEWVQQGMQGDMAWMAEEDRLGRRKDPAGMLSGVRSVITLGMRYSPPAYSLDEANKAVAHGVISAYAHGDDYHEVMKSRLKALARELDQLLGRHDQRVYVDTAPVLEHALAEGSGLGWQGKHSLTLNRDLGSWFLLGEIFTTAQLEADEKASFHCGTCCACMDVCPTRAIVAPFVVDARLCISYLSIEYKGSIPRHLRSLIGNRIYGCDDCQMVCPWNSDTQPANDFLAPRGENCLPELASLLGLDDAAFRLRFAKSPVKRIGRDSFIRNCCIAAGNSDQPGLQTQLWQLAGKDVSAIVRGHAVWALGASHSCDAAIRLEKLAALLLYEQDEYVREEISLTINDIKERL